MQLATPPPGVLAINSHWCSLLHTPPGVLAVNSHWYSLLHPLQGCWLLTATDAACYTPYWGAGYWQPVQLIRPPPGVLATDRGDGYRQPLMQLTTPLQGCWLLTGVLAIDRVIGPWQSMQLATPLQGCWLLTGLLALDSQSSWLHPLQGCWLLIGALALDSQYSSLHPSRGAGYW